MGSGRTHRVTFWCCNLGQSLKVLDCFKKVSPNLTLIVESSGKVNCGSDYYSSWAQRDHWSSFEENHGNLFSAFHKAQKSFASVLQTSLHVNSLDLQTGQFTGNHTSFQDVSSLVPLDNKCHSTRTPSPPLPQYVYFLKWPHMCYEVRESILWHDMK